VCTDESVGALCNAGLSQKRKLWKVTQLVMATNGIPQRGDRELLVYVQWGGVAEDVGKGKIRYNGGARKCVLVREGVGVEELKEMVRDTVGPGVEVD